MDTDVTPSGAPPDLREQAYRALADLPASYPYALMPFSDGKEAVIQVRHVKAGLDAGKVSPAHVMRSLFDKNMLRPTGGVS